MSLLAHLWHRWLHAAYVRSIVGEYAQYKCPCGALWMTKRRTDERREQ